MATFIDVTGDIGSPLIISLALAYERLNGIESDEKRPKEIRQTSQRDLEMV